MDAGNYTRKRDDSIVIIPILYHLVISYAKGDISFAQVDITFNPGPRTHDFQK